MHIFSFVYTKHFDIIVVYGHYMADSISRLNNVMRIHGGLASDSPAAFGKVLNYQLSLGRIPTKDLNNLAEDVETVRQNESVLVRMAMHPWFERITMAVIFLNAIWKLGATKPRNEMHKRIAKVVK